MLRFAQKKSGAWVEGVAQMGESKENNPILLTQRAGRLSGEVDLSQIDSKVEQRVAGDL